MSIRTLLFAVTALCATGAGGVTLKNIENAHEAAVSEVSLPAHTAGQLVIRHCSGCKPVVPRVDAATRYFIGTLDTPVSLKALRKAAQAPTATHRPMMIFYSLDGGQVTRILLGDR